MVILRKLRDMCPVDQRDEHQRSKTGRIDAAETVDKEVAEIISRIVVFAQQRMGDQESRKEIENSDGNALQRREIVRLRFEEMQQLKMSQQYELRAHRA